MLAALQQELAPTRERALAIVQAQDADPVTGLPKQKAAEIALQELAGRPGKHFVVTAVVNRLQPINARFGHEVGDQVLQTFKGSFEKQLTPNDRLFRWTGPALVAILDRGDTLEQVRTEVRKMLDAPTGNKMFDVGGRQVLIPVTAAWSVFMLIPPFTTAARQIQTFIAAQGSRDYA